MEAHGSPVAGLMQRAAGMLPDALAAKVTEKMGVDRLAVVYAAIDAVRRGGTVSISGVYGGAMDPLPMMQLFDKQIQLRLGQANVRRWTDDILPLVLDDGDPLGTADMATHHLPLAEAPAAYAMFQKKQDGCIKVVLHP
jgi:threonine dehydrogenase-like Zn-dependent dehydrogenase